MPSRRSIYGAITGGRFAFESESQAIFDAFDTPPADERKLLINAAVVSLKSGGVWTKLDGLWVFAAADADAALTNWKSPGTFDSTAVNSPTFTADRGYNANGTDSYVDSNFNPSTAGGSFTQNSACFGIWFRTSGQNSGSPAGFFDATDGITLNPRTTNDTFGYRINQAAQATSAAGGVTNGTGLSVGNRSAAGAVQGYKNGASIDTDTTASTALNNSNLYFGRSAAAGFVAGDFAAGLVGGSLASGEQTSLYNALNTYMVAVGAA